MQLTQRRQPRTSARAATRSPSAPPGSGGGSGSPTLSLCVDQRTALRGVGLDPVQDTAAGLDADLGVLDQIVSPFRSEPHTLIGLAMLGAYVLYFGWNDPTARGELSGAQLRSVLGVEDGEPVPDDAAALLRLQSALSLAAVVFVGYSWLQGRDGYITRPHPAFWRGAHGVTVLYFLLVVVLFAQPTSEEAREVLRVLNPMLNVSAAPPENSKEYATDCRIVDSAGFPSKILHDTVFDIFMVAHFLGWTFLFIMFRDWWICFAMSIHFEFLEMTFQYMLPNFKECWWDHVLLDILGMNWFGMWVGSLFVRFFARKDWVEYRWARPITGLGEKIAQASPRGRRIAKQFLPLEWTTVSWDVLGSGAKNATF